MIRHGEAFAFGTFHRLYIWFCQKFAGKTCTHINSIHRIDATLLGNNVIWKKCRVGSMNREEKTAANRKIKVKP
jgi:hypothetical protein